MQKAQKRRYCFERNMLSLSARDAELCKKLSEAKKDFSEESFTHYRFIESKTEDDIPAFIDKNGNAHILHSLVSPEKEAAKITRSLYKNEGYVIVLGLGSAYIPEQLLKSAVEKVVVLDYGAEGAAELFCNREYIGILQDKRFTLLIDKSPAEIEDYITATYLPCIQGGILVVPLRARLDFDDGRFAAAREAIKSAIDKVSLDYSVQAYFGKRWFSNIIRNVIFAERQSGVVKPASFVILCAAGPSLDGSLARIKEKQAEAFVISTDTALGSLLGAGITPDAVISIDCQHISFEHFAGLNIEDVPLFLDLSSPPLLFSRSKKCIFFSGGHPLASFISYHFKEFPALDTSGANVTYAGVSLAEKLGARRIEIYGADFSYPAGNTYTKGAYFYPALARLENRLRPVSTHLADFLFKNKTLSYIKKGDSFYYQTRALEVYKKNLEEKIASSNSLIVPVQGGGAEIDLRAIKRGESNRDNTFKLFSTGRASFAARDFLFSYKELIKSLPDFTSPLEVYINALSIIQRQVFFTLLPAAAAIKRIENADGAELIRRVKEFSVCEIEKVL